MSNQIRKERKRAGIPFVRIPKVGTPIEERWSFKWVNHPGDRATGVKQGPRPRAPKSVERIVSRYAGDN